MESDANVEKQNALVVVQDELDRAKEWKGVWKNTLLLVIPAYLGCLIYQWDKSMRWTAFVAKLALLNAVFCILAAVTVNLFPRKAIFARIVGTAVVCSIMPVIAAMSAHVALHSDILPYSNKSADFVRLAWWGAAFMVARSPLILHGVSETIARLSPPEDMEGLIYVQRSARRCCLVVFFICAFSDVALHAASGIEWLKITAGWIAQ